MITTLTIVFTLLLILFTIMDIKTRAVPSVLLTASIFSLAVLRFENIQYALILGIFGYMLWEFSEAEQISFGVADIKIMIMIGFFMTSLLSFAGFMIAFAVGQVFYIFAVRKWTKMEEIPFIPFLLALWIGGLVGGIWI